MNSSTNTTPIAILPGLLCDSRMFRGQLAGLPNLSVVDGFYGNADRIEDMAAYALARLPDRCVVIGHSMGARIALEAWRQVPSRIAGIVLSSTGIHSPKPGEAEKRHALLNLGRDQGIAALVAQWLPPMIGQQHRSNIQLVDMLNKMCAAAGIEIYARQINALLNRPPLDDVLPAISCPAMAIVGSDDEWSPPEQHRAIAAAIPGCALQVVSGAGHMLPAEQPDAFNQCVADWLSQHPQLG